MTTDQFVPEIATRPYAIISADGHVGADLLADKAYLESKYHPEFDAWAATSVDAWGEISSRVDADKPDAVAGEAARELTERPSEYIASNVYFGNPVDYGGAIASRVPNVMFGADLPHSERSSPYTLEALRITMSDLSEDEVRRLTSETAAECYGFDLDAVLVADGVGFTPEQVATPPDWSEMPTYPDESRCHYFARRRPPARRARSSAWADA